MKKIKILLCIALLCILSFSAFGQPYWETNGNAGIQPFEYIGTLDPEGLRIKTNSFERAEYTFDGNYQFGDLNIIGLNNSGCGLFGINNSVDNSIQSFALGNQHTITNSDGVGVIGEDLEIHSSHGSFMGGGHSTISNSWANAPYEDYNISLGDHNQILGISASAFAAYNSNIGSNNSITGSSMSATNNTNLGDFNSIFDGTFSVNIGYSNTNSKANFSHTLGNSNTIDGGVSSIAIGDGNFFHATTFSSIRGVNSEIVDSENSHILGNGNSVNGGATNSYILGRQNSINGFSNAFAIGTNISTDVDEAIKLGINGNRTQTITERGVEIQMDPGNPAYIPNLNLEVMAGSGGGANPEVKLQDLPLTAQTFENVVIDPSTFELYRAAAPPPPPPQTIDWHTTGNAGILPTDFIGTINNEGFRIWTSNNQRAEYTADGNYEFGAVTNTIGNAGNQNSGSFGSNNTITESNSVFSLGANNVIDNSFEAGVFGEDLQMLNAHGSFMSGGHSKMSNAWSVGPYKDYNTSMGHRNEIIGNTQQAHAQFNSNFGSLNRIIGNGLAVMNNSNMGESNSIQDGTHNSNIGNSNANTRSNRSHALGNINNISSAQNSIAIGDNNTFNGSVTSTARGFRNSLSQARFSHILGNSNTINGSSNAFILGNRNTIGNGLANVFAIGTNISTNVDEAIKLGFNNNRTQTITERGVEIQMDPGNSAYAPNYNLEVMAGSIAPSGAIAPEIIFQDLPYAGSNVEHVVIDPQSFELFRIPASTGGGNITADNGLSMNSPTNVQLGNGLGGNTAQLINNREVPLNNFRLVFTDNGAVGGQGRLGLGLNNPAAKMDIMIPATRNDNSVSTALRVQNLDNVTVGSGQRMAINASVSAIGSNPIGANVTATNAGNGNGDQVTGLIARGSISTAALNKSAFGGILTGEGANRNQGVTGFGNGSGTSAMSVGGLFTGNNSTMNIGCWGSAISAPATNSQNFGVEGNARNGNLAFGARLLAFDATTSNIGAFARGTGGNAATGVFADGTGATNTNIGIDARASGPGAIAVSGTVNGPGLAGFFNGNGANVGGTYQISDKRVKKDVVPINNALEILENIEPKVYEYDNTNYPGLNLNSKVESYGVIAQELKTVLPNLVLEIPVPKEDGDGFTGEKLNAVNYTELIPIVIQAVKELNTQVAKQNNAAIENEALKADIELLKEQNATMEQKFEFLEDAIARICESGCTGLDNKSNNMNAVSQDKDILYQSIPNPTDDMALVNYYLSADYEQANIKVFTQEGVQIDSFRLNTEKGKGSLKLSLGELSSGTYLYSLFINGKVIDTKKLQILK